MLLAAMSLCLAVIMPTSAQAGKKRDARVAYVLKNLRLKADVQAKFKPVLEAYLKELSDLKDPYKKLKDDLQDAIDANKLTAAQCDQLFEEKQKREKRKPLFLMFVRNSASSLLQPPCLNTTPNLRSHSARIPC